jgi:hypothetical protein
MVIQASHKYGNPRYITRDFHISYLANGPHDSGLGTTSITVNSVSVIHQSLQLHLLNFSKYLIGLLTDGKLFKKTTHKLSLILVLSEINELPV